MQTLQSFYSAFRERFPDFSTHADWEYFRYWGEDEDEKINAYSWFESLAHAINADMHKASRLAEAGEIFAYIDGGWEGGSGEVRSCIDVAFVENLFWQVPPKKSGPYWAILPDALKQLYLGFHSRPPA